MLLFLSVSTVSRELNGKHASIFAEYSDFEGIVQNYIQVFQLFFSHTLPIVGLHAYFPVIFA